MSNGLVVDSIPSPDAESPNSGPRFRPYSTPSQHVAKGRYITSNDPRGYIPVYEYPLNGQWIMLDMDDGYVLWTGIWKALGNSKADIVKMTESQPDLASKLRRVRGGYLKIQGTWMPYEIALCLARRVAWPIRHELVPLFGPTFPSSCLSPDQPGYGQVVNPGNGRRRMRRTYQPANVAETPAGWATVAQTSASQVMASTNGPERLSSHRQSPIQIHQEHYQAYHSGSPVQLHMPYAHQHPAMSPVLRSPVSPYAASGSRLSSSPPSNALRYSPYPSSASFTHSATASSPVERSTSLSAFADSENLRLPPLRDPGDNRYRPRNSSFALPPISALDDVHKGRCDDSAAVLRRLKALDDTEADRERAPSPRHREAPCGHNHNVIAQHAINTRLPPIHLPASSLSGSSTSSPYLSPTSGAQHSSAVSSPSSATGSVVTPLSARSSLDEPRVAHWSPLLSVPEARSILSTEHLREYKRS